MRQYIVVCASVGK